MDPITLKNEILNNWKDDSEMIGLTKNPAPGYSEANGMLYNAQFYMMIELLGISSQEDRDRFFNNLRDATVEINGTTYPGLFHRHPKMIDMLEAHDNYCGVMAALAAIDTPTAHYFMSDVLYYGNMHSFLGLPYYNNLEPDKFNIRCLRQGSELAFYQVCFGRKPNIINYLWLVGNILCSIKGNETSTKILSFMKLEILKRDSRTFRFVNKIFHKFVDIRSVVNGYFGDKPLASLINLYIDQQY